jgi:hypothetical protein
MQKQRYNFKGNLQQIALFYAEKFSRSVVIQFINNKQINNENKDFNFKYAVADERGNGFGAERKLRGKPDVDAGEWNADN